MLFFILMTTNEFD